METQKQVSLSRHLQQSIFGGERPRDLAQLKARVLDAGMAWWADNGPERDSLGANLAAFGLAQSQAALDAAMRHTVLHYYEKLVPLFCTATSYAAYLTQRVEGAEGVAQLGRTRHAGKACLIAISHFGAVELITPTLAMHGLPVSAALRFTTQQLSDAAAGQAHAFLESGKFSEVRFIEIGKPGVAAALEMAAVVRTGGVMLSVCDERTEYSVPVKLLGRDVWGGSGLDRLIKFARAPLSLFGAFMVRTGDERYRLVIREIPDSSTAPIQELFDVLGGVVSAHPEQWYFLHEEIPFVESKGT